MNCNISAILKKEIVKARGLSRLTIANAEILKMDAMKVMWKYYSEHKKVLPKNIREFRGEIIVRLMKGEDVVEVFSSILGTKNQ